MSADNPQGLEAETVVWVQALKTVNTHDKTSFHVGGGGGVECIIPRQSPQCVLLVCEKFAENPEFRVGNVAVHLKREISNTKLKCHDTPPRIFKTGVPLTKRKTLSSPSDTTH